jgi:hypothetical protein
LVFLAGLVGSFEWSPADSKGIVEPDHDSTITLKVNGGLHLAVKEVGGW